MGDRTAFVAVMDHHGQIVGDSGHASHRMGMPRTASAVELTVGSPPFVRGKGDVEREIPIPAATWRRGNMAPQI